MCPPPALARLDGMTVTLNERAYEHAQRLIKDGRIVHDGRDAWSEHRPSARQENEFIEAHGWDEYQRWFLGIDDEHGENTKERHKFPYGDFQDVHRCAVLSAESRAGQYDHVDIELACAHLHGMVDALPADPESRA
jgi:hypothetical protein